jgi:hypothetical protein
MIFEKQLRQEGIRLEINKLTIENRQLYELNKQLKQCIAHMTSDYLKSEQSEILLECCKREIEKCYGKETALTMLIRDHLNDTEVKNYENSQM